MLAEVGSLWRWADDGLATEYDEPLAMILADEPSQKKHGQTAEAPNPIPLAPDEPGPQAAQFVEEAPSQSSGSGIGSPVPDEHEEAFNLELIAALTATESSRHEESPQSQEISPEGMPDG